jgi:ATP-dependent DNA helicase RecG
MLETDLLGLINKGEDSKHQFKVTVDSIDKLAIEIAAFLNTDGGLIICGVSDQQTIIGLSSEQIHSLNQWISSAASQRIEPPSQVKTEILTIEQKNILIIDVPMGKYKPYSVNHGEYWVKNGADKRRASREELFRMMQASHSLFADELETAASFDSFNVPAFSEYYLRSYQEKISDIGIPLQTFLTNKKLMINHHLTIAGLMLFGIEPENIYPQFAIKCTSFPGNVLTTNDYKDSETIRGTLLKQYQSGLYFINRNLHKIPTEKDFNASSKWEIPEIAIREALSNAIVHRDYFINSSIQINLFNDRLEILSPGKLPNTLTEENIRSGIHIERNPIILITLEKDPLFKYSGKGSGIPRILQLCREEDIQVDLVNDVANNQFKVVFWRKR